MVHYDNARISAVCLKELGNPKHRAHLLHELFTVVDHLARYPQNIQGMVSLMSIETDKIDPLSI